MEAVFEDIALHLQLLEQEQQMKFEQLKGDTERDLKAVERRRAAGTEAINAVFRNEVSKIIDRITTTAKLSSLLHLLMVMTD